MVRHIVFFKLKNPTQDQKEALKAKLLSLKDQIDYIRFLEVGINFTDEERAYDLALICDLDTKDDLKKYATDPYHLDVIAYVKEVISSSKIVDYLY